MSNTHDATDEIAQTQAWVQEAMSAHAAGRLEAAQALYRRVLQRLPAHGQAHHNLGIIAMQQKQLPNALSCFAAAVQAAPAESQFGLSYAKALILAERAREALQVLDALHRLDPHAEEVVRKLRQRAKAILNSPAHALQEAGDLLARGEFAATEQSLQRFTQQYPTDPAGWTLLAATYQAQGRLALALSAAQTAAKLAPADADRQGNLGAVYVALGHYDEAEHAYLAAHRLAPHSYRWNCCLADVYKEKRVFEDAEKYGQQALKLNATGIEACCTLGEVFQAQGHRNKAIDMYRKCLAINNIFFAANKNIAIIYIAEKRFSDAAFYLEKILDAEKTAEIYFSLTDIKLRSNEYELAKIHAKKGLALDPENGGGHAMLANAMAQLGQYDTFLFHIRKALDIDPTLANTSEVLLFSLAYKGLVGAADYLAEAKQYEGRIFSPALLHGARQHALHGFKNPAITDRKMRVAYLSGDFREHAVTYFLKTILKSVDTEQQEVYLYSNNAQEDAVTAELKTLCKNFVRIEAMSDDDACARIRADQIDVLIDLSGYTAFARVGVIARRSAPVQAHYLGFFATTGLTEMDYWIGDAVIIPPQAHAHFSETVWILPRVWVSYLGREDCPPTARVPDEVSATPAPTVRFATFNQFAKLTADTLRVWAQIMHAVPGSTLLIKTKTLDSAVNRSFIESEMDKLGIAADRLELRGATASWVEHMAMYGTVDIALDPVGSYSGGTTTADALWMGVPVITLAGERMSQRMTASMVDAIGQPDWIAYSEAEYVDKVVALSNDAAKRQALRPGQRERMRASPLCDGPGLSRALSDAYMAMFDMWQQRQTLGF